MINAERDVEQIGAVTNARSNRVPSFADRQLERQRDDAGETLFSIYHSHVASPAYPSPTDVRMAFFPPGATEQPPMYPETYYILVSLQHEEADVRAYHIRQGGTIEEEPIEVV